METVLFLLGQPHVGHCVTATPSRRQVRTIGMKRWVRYNSSSTGAFDGHIVVHNGEYNTYAIEIESVSVQNMLMDTFWYVEISSSTK